MPRTAEEQAAARAQRLGLEVRVGLEMTDVGDEELDLFSTQRAAEFFPVIHVEAGAHLGVGAEKACHRLRHQVHRRRRAAAEAQLAGIELGHLLHFAVQLRRALHQA
ncbi:hypothetical protein D3C76_1477200 [compost metagenome]